MRAAHARDIPDLDFLAAVRSIVEAKGYWANRFEVQSVLADTSDYEVAEGLIPSKVVLAKMRRLESRFPALITCCSCGCRGDIELTSCGERLLVLAETSA